MITTNNNHTEQHVFFTICAKNFLAHAKALYGSVKKNYPDARFFVVLCDLVDHGFDPNAEPFEFIHLDDLAIPDFASMSQRYNITELNTAVKPFVFIYLFQKYALKNLVYLDPDLYFIDRLHEVDNLLNEGVEAILTPHILSPAENSELDDRKFLLFGIYNLGFLALSNTPSTINFLNWWSSKLKNLCIINLQEGIFVDQKWCDLLPAFVKKTHILHHAGYNVAYWNLPQRQITKKGESWFANQDELRFVHFSGNQIDNPDVFSRHSKSVTIESIGDLKLILDDYREQVYANGHAFYRNLPYSFSWNGESGVNLHTPDTLDMAKVQRYSTVNKTSVKRMSIKSKASTLIKALRVARNITGGYPHLARRAWLSYKMNGLAHVKKKVVDLALYKTSPKSLPEEIVVENNAGMKNLLFIDWSIPKPDQDAASVYNLLLLKILASEGYNVSLLPCNLKYEEGYSKNLADAGIHVLYYHEVQAIDKWLENNIQQFDLCVLTRGPVVWPYLKLIKKYAPTLKLIFNTIDLHHVRELRQAELLNDHALKESAFVTKKQEYDLINTCDLTLLISTDEAYEVRKESPNAKVAVLPLVYDAIPGANKSVSFNQRKDILFIGSFPHLPNIDAVEYFVENIFPLLKKLDPDIKLKIIGANPPEKIANYASDSQIEILGFVADLTPIYDNIRLSIAPLRFGAGIKGKIAGSMCLGVPCVVTPLAAEGMGLTHQQNVLIADAPETFAKAIFEAYTDETLWSKLSENGTQFALENYSYDVVKERVQSLLWSLNEGWSQVQSAFEITSWDSYLAHSKKLELTYQQRLLTEQTLLPTNGSDAFTTRGFCAVCSKKTEFLTSFMYSTGNTPDGRPMPNWREHMQCKHCKLVNRVRASLHTLHIYAPPNRNSRIYITEQVTPTFDWLKMRYPNVQGSEYLGEEHASGAVVNHIRNENFMQLSFTDNAFDYVLSFDVLEHVPNPTHAFNEAYRVLDNGGTFMFSVPFSYDSHHEILRATLHDDGKIEHHLPPEYHGNPVDPEGGALCFRYFGWDMLEQLKSIGFTKVKAIAYWSEEQGYLGREQYLFIAKKI